MSTTHKFKVALDLTIVSSSDSIDQLKVARATVRAALQTEKGKEAYEEASKLVRYGQDLFAGDLTDEELIVQILRNGIRDTLRDTLKDQSTRDQTIKVGDVKVSLQEAE